MAHIQLRPAVLEDAEMIFEWRNDPWIVARGTTGQTVSWEEHYAWFKETVAEHNRQMFIVLCDERPVGQVRFDRVDARACEVSIYLVREYTGRGLGVKALREACGKIFDLWDVDLILASIRADNYPSLSAFRKAGFSVPDTYSPDAKPDHVELRLARPIRVPHNRLTYDEEEVQAVTSVVASGQWAGGPKVRALEQALASEAEVQYAVGVASGLAALRLGLKGLGVTSGDELIVPAYSCVALATAPLALDAEPVPVDIQENDWNIDPRAVRDAVTARTRAVVLVNTFGAPAPITALRDLEIPLIEDCAHAFGMAVPGGRFGGRGDIGTLSFYATKLIGGGEGGAVLTNDPTVAETIKNWRDYGDKPPDRTRLNDKMNDLEASLALMQLTRLPSMLEARARLARIYNEFLTPLAEHTGRFRLPQPVERRVWYRYVIQMIDVPAVEIIGRLREDGVQAEQPVTDWRSAESPAAPVADRAYRSLVSLPLYPSLQEEEQEFVCDTVQSVIEEL